MGSRVAAKRVWIACGSSLLERRAFENLCDLLGDEGLLIEHAARTLRHRADRLRLVGQLHSHQPPGRSVLFVRRLDRLGSTDQARLCRWLANGGSGADCIVATGRLPRTQEQGFQRRVGVALRPHLEMVFDALENEPIPA